MSRSTPREIYLTMLMITKIGKNIDGTTLKVSSTNHVALLNGFRLNFRESEIKLFFHKLNYTVYLHKNRTVKSCCYC